MSVDPQLQLSGVDADELVQRAHARADAIVVEAQAESVRLHGDLQVAVAMVRGALEQLSSSRRAVHQALARLGPPV